MLDVAPRGNGAVTPFVVQPEVLPGNGLLSTLANAITAVATTLNIQAGDAVNWPSSGVYRAVICQDPINGPWELVMVTGGQGSSTLQVTRAAESYNGNTTAYAWPVGTSISAVLTQAGLTAWRGAGGGGGTDVSSYFRSTGPGTLPTTGVGTEMFYQGTVQPTSAYTGSFYPHDYDPAGKAVMSSSEMNIGLSFTVDVACTLQAITFFRSDPPTQDIGPTSHNFGLYNAGTQALLWSGWTNGEVDYWNPISVGYALQPGVTYMAVVHISAANGVYQQDASFLGTAGNIWPGPVPMHYVSSSTGSYATLAFPGTTLATPDGMGLDVVISGPPASSGFQAYGAWFDPNISGNRNNSEGGQGANGGLAFTVTQPCLLTQVRWFRPTQDTDVTSRPMALYDRRTPGTPLWTGSTSAEVAGQWNTVAVPSISLQPGVPYMLAWHLFPNSYWRDVWQYYTPFARGPLQIEAGFLDDSWPNLVCPVYYFGQDFMGADLVVSVAQQNRAVVQTYDHAAGAPGPLEIDASALTLNAQTVVAPNGLQIGTFARQSTLFFAGPNPDVTGNEVPDMSYAVSVAQSRRNGSYLSVRTAGTGGVYTDWSTLAVCGWTGGDSASGSNPGQTWKGSGGRIYLSKNGDLDYGGSMVLDSSGNIQVNSVNGQNKSSFYINIDSYTVINGQWYGGSTFLYANLPAYVNIGYTQYPSPSQASVSLAVGNNALVQDSTAHTAYGVYTLVGPSNSGAYDSMDLSVYYARVITNSATTQASSHRGLFVDTPTYYSGTVFRNTYGVFIANQSPNTAGTSVSVGCYGVYVAPQSGINANTYGLYVGAVTSTNGTSAGVYIAPATGNLSNNISLDCEGQAYFNGAVGIQSWPTNTALLLVSGAPASVLQGSFNYGLMAQMVFPSTTTSAGYAIYSRGGTASGAFTMTNSYAFYADAPYLGPSSAITSSYGLYVVSMGKAGVTNAYGIYIAAQSGAATTNIGLVNMGTSQFQNNVMIGNSTPTAGGGSLLALAPPYNMTTGTSQTMISVAPSFGPQATFAGACIKTTWQGYGAAGAYTMTSGYGVWINQPTVITNVTVTSMYGLYVGNQGASAGGSVSSAYGIYIAAQSGASSLNYGLYNNGNTQLYGNVGIGTGVGTQIIVSIGGAYMSSIYQTSLSVVGQFSSGCTGYGVGVEAYAYSAAAAFTIPAVYVYRADIPQLGSGSAVTALYGFYAANQGAAGVTNAFGMYVAAQSGAATTNIGVYIAQNASALLLGGTGSVPTNSCGAGIVLYATTGAKIALYDAGSGTFYGMSVNPAEMTFNLPATSSSWAFRWGVYNGTIVSSCTGSGAWTGASFTPSSSRSFKLDIVPLVDPLALVLDDGLHGVSYFDTRQSKHTIGFVADDWQGPLPEVVVTDDDGTPVALDYDRIGAVTFEALKRYVTRTDNTIRALEARLEALEGAST